MIPLTASSGSAAPAHADALPAVRLLARNLLEDLAARGSGMVEEIWARMRASEPYEELGAFQSAEIQNAVRSTFVTFVDCLAEGRSFTIAEIEGLEALGAARARQGIALETVSRNFRSALRHAYGHLLELAGARREPNVLEVMAELSLAVMELMLDATEAVHRGYSTEDEQRTTMRSRAQRALVESLLDGVIAEEALRTGLIEMGLRPGRVCALAVGVARSDGATDPRRAVDALVAALPHALEGLVRTLPDPHVVIVALSWSPQITQTLDELAREHDLAVVVATAERLSDLGDTYRRLRQCTRLIAAAAGESAVIPMDEFAVYEVIGGSTPATAQAFVRGAIGPLLALPESRCVPLLETVMALHRAGGHVATAADDLALHDRSVRYRIETVAAHTGLELADAGDLMTATLAVHLLRLHRASLPPLGDPQWACPASGDTRRSKLEPE